MKGLPQTDVPPVTVRPILWPTHEGHIFDTADTSLADAGAEELRFYAEHYAGLSQREVMQRLRRAEWNAAEYQGQAEQLQADARQMPSLGAIREVDARHKRLKALLSKPGRISRALLIAALSEPDDTWNTRAEAS